MGDSQPLYDGCGARQPCKFKASNSPFRLDLLVQRTQRYFSSTSLHSHFLFRLLTYATQNFSRASLHEVFNSPRWYVSEQHPPTVVHRLGGVKFTSATMLSSGSKDTSWRIWSILSRTWGTWPSSAGLRLSIWPRRTTRSSARQWSLDNSRHRPRLFSRAGEESLEEESLAWHIRST